MKKIFASFLFLSCTSGACAQHDVAIAAAANLSGFPTACQWADVHSMLVASGQFSSVSFVDVNDQVPTLAELQQFDAIITWTNGSYDDGVAMGDVFADYVDAGGGVVVAVFANSSITQNRSLEGRWSTGYDVILPRTGTKTGQAFLGSVSNPAHPIMNGVTNFDGNFSYRPQSTVLAPGATEIAQWDDGRTLVAVGANPARVDLGFYPPSSNCIASAYWIFGTDGDKLLSNALAFAADNAGTGCYADCDGSSTLNILDFICFGDAFAAGDPYADCDASTTLNILDFICYGDAFAAGCP